MLHLQRLQSEGRILMPYSVIHAGTMSMILSNQYFKAHMLGSDEYTSNDIDVEIQREIDASGHWLNHNEPQGMRVIATYSHCCAYLS